MTDTSREAYGAWAKADGLDVDTWSKNPGSFKYKSANDSWVAWQASRAALEAEQAQAVESAGYWLERAKELVEIFEDAPSFSEVATEINVKQPLSTERAELIGRLRQGMKLTNEYGLAGTALVLQSAADMLEADAQWRSLYEQREEEAHKRSEQIIKLRAQQAAVPVGAIMTSEKAAYFMRRFKKEEKLLGPNEQKAIDYVLAMLETAPQGDKT